jgi:hypothetical protein
MKHIGIGVVLTLFIGCAGGTETDNPATRLVDFASSECKSEAGAPAAEARVLSSDAEGLQCVEWEKLENGELLLNLLNFPEACGEDYRAALGERDGALGVTLYKQSCEVFRCGTCVFDFEMRIAGANLERDLPLQFGSAVCETKPATFTDDFVLPLAQQHDGIACRYLNRSALEQYGRARGTCGQRNMPCGDCMSVGSNSCAEGLTCTEVASGDSRCLAACETEADCAGGLTACHDGLCRSADAW